VHIVLGLSDTKKRERAKVSTPARFSSKWQMNGTSIERTWTRAARARIIPELNFMVSLKKKRVLK